MEVLKETHPSTEFMEISSNLSPVDVTRNRNNLVLVMEGCSCSYVVRSGIVSVVSV